MSPGAMDKNVVQPPSKRKCVEIMDSEEVNDLNNTLQSLMDDVTTKQEKSIEDVLSILCTFIKRDMAKEQKQKEITHKLVELEKKSLEQEVVIEMMQNEICSLKKKLHKFDSVQNRGEQKKIDNDVYISLFPSKPHADAVAKSLLTLTNLPENSLRDSFSFPLRITPTANSTQNQPSQASSKFALVMSFHDFKSKMNFLKARRELGPIKVAQLMSSAPNPGLTIKTMNRLTAFNLKALKGLNQAKGDNKIIGFKMQNGLFRFQRSIGDLWNVVESEDQLEELSKNDDIVAQSNNGDA